MLTQRRKDKTSLATLHLQIVEDAAQWQKMPRQKLTETPSDDTVLRATFPLGLSSDSTLFLLSVSRWKGS